MSLILLELLTVQTKSKKRAYQTSSDFDVIQIRDGLHHPVTVFQVRSEPVGIEAQFTEEGVGGGQEERASKLLSFLVLFNLQLMHSLQSVIHASMSLAQAEDAQVFDPAFNQQLIPNRLLINDFTAQPSTGDEWPSIKTFPTHRVLDTVTQQIQNMYRRR